MKTSDFEVRDLFFDKIAHRIRPATTEPRETLRALPIPNAGRFPMCVPNEAMTEGDLRADWNTKDAQFWSYIGSDPDQELLA